VAGSSWRRCVLRTRLNDAYFCACVLRHDDAGCRCCSMVPFPTMWRLSLTCSFASTAPRRPSNYLLTTSVRCPAFDFFSIQKCCSLTRCATRSTGPDTRVHATHQAQGGGADQNAVWDEDFCGLRPAQRFSLRVARARFMLQNKPLRLRGGKERWKLLLREADAPNHY